MNAHGQLWVCSYLQDSPVEIQTPTRWNLIVCSMIAPPTVLSPSSILPSTPLYCALIPARKTTARISTLLFQYFLKFEPRMVQAVTWSLYLFSLLPFTFNACRTHGSSPQHYQFSVRCLAGLDLCVTARSG